MKEYKNKWNNYEIGSIKWIDINREHCCREKFVEYMERENIKSIIEVGGGELIEAQKIISKDTGVDYVVVDVSDTFLKFANSINGVSAFKGDMIDIPFDNKEYDLIYCSSVLEHSPDIRNTIKEMSRVSNKFYFNMFTWNMKTGNLESVFQNKKKYYSTVFNIDMLLELIGEYGKIEEMAVYSRDGGDESWDDYRRDNPDIDENRNGKYLLIRGSWIK